MTWAGNGARRLGAVAAPVSQDRSSMGALGAPVLGMQVDDERCPGCPQRQGEVGGHPVCVARPADHVAQGDSSVRHLGEGPDHGGTGPWAQAATAPRLPPQS